MRFSRIAAYPLFALLFVAAVAQAATCPAIVEQAVSSVAQDCATVGRNQACYGFVSLQATPRENVQNFTFSKQGDLANLADLSNLRLSHLDPANNTWGIAVMKVQANLPETLPGQNVTFLLFGDVDLQNASSSAGIPITAKSRMNIRGTPSTSGPIIGTLSGHEAATATGRNADGSWLQIQIPDSNAIGWVSAGLVTLSGDVQSLPTAADTSAQTAYTPMQAFYFSTGIEQPGCSEAPADGILIQTPEGAGQINLRANDVDIQLGSTAFLQAQASGNMTVTVVEGKGHVTVGSASVDVPAGTQVTIPMDAKLKPSGPPSAAHAYDAALVRPLPLQLLPLKFTLEATPEPTAEMTAEATTQATAEATMQGSGGGNGGSSGGGTSGGSAFDVVKTMNMSGETLKGTVCAVASPFALMQPFAVTMVTRRVTFDIHFVPTGATQGTWSYEYDIPRAGETDKASGNYTISAASAGAYKLVMDGSGSSKFRGGNPSFSLHYEMQLSPSATNTCAG